MSLDDLSIIVIGGLNTDIVALGANKLLKAGEQTFAEKLHIGAGGKSRNIAQMIATLCNKNNIAMVGKSSKDPYGLWKLPIDSLSEIGVNTEYITVASFDETNQFPGIALVPVDKHGRNQIYLLPGINNDFLPQDIENADDLYQTAAKNNGMLVLTLELPYVTALYAIQKANNLGIKVMFDPGGINDTQDYEELLNQEIYLLKPNEHEAEILTDVRVKDISTAKQAAEKLLAHKVQNVFITVGAQGGYLFNKHFQKHISVPRVKTSSNKDETGCGDQAMAAFIIAISEGKTIVDAASTAIIAGTLQFYKSGIRPITREELLKYL